MACYRKSYYNYLVIWGEDVRCNPDSDRVSDCCVRGTTCLGNNICYTSTDIPEGGTGFFMSGCTDPTYQDSRACNPLCTNQNRPDIIYSSDSELWHCCGAYENGTVTCSSPTSETFYAPPPNQLLAAISFKASSSSSSTTSTSSPTSSSASTANALVTPPSEPTQAPRSGDDSGLSGGAIAGIVIGVLAGIALVAGLAFWFGRRRGRTRNVPAHETTGFNVPSNAYTDQQPAVMQYFAGSRHELHSTPITELQTDAQDRGRQYQMPS